MLLLMSNIPVNLLQLEFAGNWINDFIDTYSITGFAIVVGLVIALFLSIGWYFGQRGDKDRDTATANQMNAFAKQSERTSDRLDRMEKKLEAERELKERERKLREQESELHKQTIKQLDDEREKIKEERKTSEKDKRELGEKITLLAERVDALQSELNALKVERELDKVEKEQILSESAKVKEQNKVLSREKGEALKNNRLLEQMLGQQSDRIAKLEERLGALEKNLNEKDHDLRLAQGTIATLSASLKNYTDDTQKLPELEDIENAGNEVITPVLKLDEPLQVQIVMADDETPDIVPPVDTSTDNKPDDENKKDVA